MTEPSDIYKHAVVLTRGHHRSQHKTFSGQFTWKYRHRIKAIIDKYDVKSILDYGCGKGKQYQNVDEDSGQNLEQYWGVSTVKYDPGVGEYEREPVGKFDLVICVQVLGSIPTQDLSWVIDKLYGHANKAVFVAERLKMPRKQIYASIEEYMPYGMTKEEWIEQLRRPSEDAAMHVILKSETGWYESRIG